MGLVVGVGLGVDGVGEAGAGLEVLDEAPRWKSSIGSSRSTRCPALITSAADVTRYSIPSLSAVNEPSDERVADTMSLAPSRTRTPRYS